MDHYTRISDQNDENFRRSTGVKRSTFNEMLSILRKAELHRGRRPKLTLENRLLMALKYLREYVTFASLGDYFGLDESNVIRTVHWVEDVLSKSDFVHLPGKKTLLKPELSYEVFVVDATESPIERPKRPRGKKEST